MTALHFGPSDSPLFGVYHPALVREPRAPAVILMNPFGVEAIRSNRMFRLLAEKLAATGSAVLRFDYYGTGDSAGSCDEFTMAGARMNIQAAHQELLDLSGAKRVVWVGLRLGAMLALQAVLSEKPKSLRGIVLWDLIANGSDYWAELQEAHFSELARAFDQPLAKVKKTRENALHEILGVEVSPEFVAELNESYLAENDQLPVKFLSLVGAHMTSSPPSPFQNIPANVKLYDDPTSSDWNSDEALNAFTVPAKTLDVLIAAIGDMR